MMLALKPSDLIASPETWTRLSWAVDRWGFPCDVHDPDAVAWDITGAVAKMNQVMSIVEAARFAALRLGRMPISLNDSNCHADVVKVMVEAGL